jgi:hypothetical protein
MAPFFLISAARMIGLYAACGRWGPSLMEMIGERLGS